MGTCKNISWLASYPKSGSTWVRMFINAFVSRFPLNINSSYQISRSDIDPGILQLICPTNIKELTHSEQFIYRPAMLMNMLKLAPGRLVLKTHNAKVAVDALPAIPVNISDPSIYVIRDPRDVAISLSHHMGSTIDATIEFMNNMSQGIEDKNSSLVNLLLTWSKHVDSWTASNSNLSTFVVRYEDLLTNSEETFVDIINFLDLNTFPDFEERLHFALNESSFTQLVEYEKTKGFVEKGEGEKFFRVGKSGQWREILTLSQIDKIYDDHKEIMENFGYEKSVV